MTAIGGEGSKNVAIGLYQQTTVVAARGLSAVPEELVRFACSDAYVAPHVEERKRGESAVDVFGIVVIEGELGSGRETDAFRLLSWRMEAAEPLTIHRLPADWEMPTAAALPRMYRSRFILDLSGEDELTESFARELFAYGQELRRLSSAIAVLVTPKIWRRARPAAERFTVLFRKRPADEIIRAHFAYRDREGRRRAQLSRDLVERFIEELVRGEASPGEAVAVAERLLTAGSRPTEEVIDECRKWADFIAKQLGGRRPGEADRRVLLLAVAALNGCPTEAVAAADRLLSRQLRLNTAPPYQALETAGWSKRLREIEATVRNDTTFVDSGRPGVDWAILAWTWREHPELRNDLIDWLRGLLKDPATRPHLDRIADVLAFLIAEFPTAWVVDRAHDWLKSDQEKDARLGFLTIEKALHDVKAAPLIRKKLWDWAYRGNTKDIPALARLCTGDFGRTYPHAALGRLRHLVTRASTAAHRLAVAEALRALSASDDLAVLVLTKVVGWTTEDTAPAAGVRGIAALLDPRPEGEVLTRLLALAQRDENLIELLSTAWTAITSADSMQDEVSAIVVALSERWSALPDSAALVLAQVFQRAIQTQLHPAGRMFLAAMGAKMKSDVLTYTVETSLRHSATVLVERQAPVEPLPPEFSPPIGGLHRLDPGLELPAGLSAQEGGMGVFPTAPDSSAREVEADVGTGDMNAVVAFE